MTTTAIDGPQSVVGAPPPYQGPTPPLPNAPPPTVTNSNPDFGPSLFWMGRAIRDIRYLAHIAAGANVGGYPNQDCGWFAEAPLIDYAPSAVATANIAALQNATAGTPLTLVSGTGGAGITKSSAPYTVLPTGLVVPLGSLIIDGVSNWVGSGQSGAFSFMNPANSAGRAVSITGVVGGAGGVFSVVGADAYGVTIHQNLTVAAGVNTVNSTKTYKWIYSVTPQFTDAHNYSVGTADIYGLPLYCPQFAYATVIAWNNTIETASAGFVAGVTTPATALTGDVRGTYAIQGDSSNGTKRLQVAQMLAFGVIASTYAAALQNLVGVSQF